MNLAMDLIREALLGGGSGGGGGGGSSWEKIYTVERAYSTTSTSKTQEEIFTIKDTIKALPNTYIWIRVRDKAGKRSDYFYGTDYLAYKNIATEPNNSFNLGGYVMVLGVNSSGSYKGTTGDSSGNYVYGVWGVVDGDCNMRTYTRYNNSYGTIDGTYVIDVYALTPPDGVVIEV
jgi:hypothetical protein